MNRRDLADIGKELRRIAPELGPVLDEKVFLGSKYVASSFRQTAMYSMSKLGVLDNVLVVMDEEVFLPRYRADKTQFPERAEGMLRMVGDWALRESALAPCDYVDDDASFREVFVALVARLGVGLVLEAAEKAGADAIVAELRAILHREEIDPRLH